MVGVLTVTIKIVELLEGIKELIEDIIFTAFA
jgi:hypothetical protein